MMVENPKTTQRHICAICKKRFEGYGNNPRPVKESGLCCDECNKNIVIPERWKEWR